MPGYHHSNTDMDTAHPATPPPSYNTLDHGAYRHKAESDALLEEQDGFSIDHYFPPQANYFVRATTNPSSWQRLYEPAISNATTSTNFEPTKKHRYRVVYPPGYEDVYLHKSLFQSNSSEFPRYHAQLFSTRTKARYEPEPLIILGPKEHDEALTNEAKNTAISLLPKVFSRIEAEVGRTQKFAMFCQSEYSSWDWGAKTNGAKVDMRSMIAGAKRACIKCGSLIDRLEGLLEFTRRDGESQERYWKILRVLRRRTKDASVRLERLLL